MKKLTLALVLLTALGLVAATAEMDAEATISGSATATIGYDLAAGAFGMVNSATSDISINIVPTASAETGMADMGWYGWVELADFQIAFEYGSGDGFDYVSAVDSNGDAIATDGTTVDTGAGDVLSAHDSGVVVTAPSVTAKIIGGPLSIQIWALNGMTTDFVAAVEDDADDDYAVEGDDSGIDVATDLSDGSGGFTFAYTGDMFSASVSAATETGYDGENPADNGHFLVAADGSVMAGPATISFGVTRGIGVEQTLGFGGNVDLAMDPLTAYVGFDGQLPDGGTFAWEVGFGAGLTAGPATVDIAGIYGAATNMDLEVTSTLDFSPLTVDIFAGLYNMFTGYRFSATGTFAATDDISIAVTGGYDSDMNIPITVAATMDLIPQTEFVLQYTTADVTSDLGDISFATTISY